MKPRPTWTLVACLAAASLAVTGCAGSSRPAAADRLLAVRWAAFRHLPGVVDLAGPRADGSLTVAAAGRLFLLSRGGVLTPFARGAGGYSTASGPEPYITATPGGAAVPCPFPPDTIFAIEPGTHPGVIAVDSRGRASRFADLPNDVAPDGITFDTTGRFGHRLLVTARAHGVTDLLAVDCRSAVETITARGPAVEGGIVVAPPSFGQFGGDLIAPDEVSGRLLAFRPDGTATVIASSGLPSGGDIGVESAGFVPPGFGPSGAAYMADRFSAHNAHPGTNSILSLPGSQLERAGVRPGDLLVATEGGARTIVVRCARSCSVRHVADGPPVSHGEGHIVFAAALPA